MAHSRRDFLKGAVATAAMASVPMASSAIPWRESGLTRDQMARWFGGLPGDKAVTLFAPGPTAASTLRLELNANETLFAASANKTFALCEALRQVDSPHVVDTLGQTQLALDDSVWSLGSPIFNPPNVSGIVSARTALEAMISRSDNTATDMVFKMAGVSRIRQFIASANLAHTRVPDSTRAFAAYLFGAANYLTITWQELLDATQGPMVRPFLNPVETFATSTNDMVSYYSRALQGTFFRHRQTLNEFRRILTLCDYIYLVPLPMGASVYAKSGNADIPGFHVRTIAGGMFFSGRWVYFAFLINWNSQKADDQRTVDAFFSAINRVLTVVKDTLSCQPPSIGAYTQDVPPGSE